MRRLVGLNEWKLNLDFHPVRNTYDRVFTYLFVVSAILRTIWLDKPQGLLIFDETYYVNAARVILKLPQNPEVFPNAVPGLDCGISLAHPPLAKLLIALSMSIMGHNGWGWRIPSVIFGLLSIFVLYLLLKKVAGNPLVALMGAFLFSFDTLVFVHSRIATLDIFVLGFMLLGFYWYFSGRMTLSAIAMGLATLCKVTGLYGVLALGVFHFGRALLSKGQKTDWRSLLAATERYVIVYLISFLVLLTMLDFFFTCQKNPIEHLAYIYNVAIAIRTPDIRLPNDIWSYPWEWLIDQVKIHYATVNVTVYADQNVARTYPSVDFIGAMNPTIVFLTIPAMLYSAYRCYETRNDFSLFVLAWFAMTYLTYIPEAIFAHRTMYIFYFLNTVPAVAASVAGMIVDQKPPRIVVIFYVAAVIIGFYMMFPFKVIP